jgi:hypothetical protein
VIAELYITRIDTTEIINVKKSGISELCCYLRKVKFVVPRRLEIHEL